MTSLALNSNTEATRLAALHRYHVLDTPGEEAFDLITTLSSLFFDVPIVLLGFIDEQRLWFKSASGIELSEVDRSTLYCEELLSSGATLILSPEAVTKDDGSHVATLRFFAGAPVRTIDNHILGMLCLLDSVPRSLSSDEVAALELLAELAMRLIESHASTVELTAEVTALQKAARSKQAAEHEYRESTLRKQVTAMILERLGPHRKQLRSALKHAWKSKNQASPESEIIQQAASTLLRRVHRLSTDIGHSDLEAGQLNQAVEQLVSDFSAHVDLEIDFVQDTLPDFLPLSVHKTSYWLVEEILGLLLLYSNVTAVQVCLSFVDEAIQLEISHEGPQLKVDRIPVEEMAPIKSLTEHLALAGGFLFFPSRPEQGKLVTAQVPMGFPLRHTPVPPNRK